MKNADPLHQLTFAAILGLFSVLTIQAQEIRLLSGHYTLPLLAKQLLPRDSFVPYPPYADRSAWAAVPQDLRQQYLDQGLSAKQYQWPQITATLWLDFVRTGDRNRFQELQFERRKMLAHLVLAELIEGKGQFLDAILNGVWATCEESFWGLPAHLSLQAAGNGLPDVEEPTVDLFAAQTGALLSWIHYFFKADLDKISPLLSRRIQKEVQRRILEPVQHRNDFFWMGFDYDRSRRVNNWNPWIASNWLTAALLLSEDEAAKQKAVGKILVVLDQFISPHPKDGGCDEGPSYWSRAGGSLYDCLDLLHRATNGKIDAFQDTVIRNIGQYIYKAWINGDYFVNFADAAPVFQPDGDLIFHYGRHIRDTLMMAFGAQRARQFNGGTWVDNWDLHRSLDQIMHYETVRRFEAQSPLLQQHYWPDLQVMIARSQALADRGLFLAAKGGSNDESHNHNDVGQFILYKNGVPFIIDPGVGHYTAKTFSKRRYEIWTMQSAYHNLPLINGNQQQAGPAFKAREVEYQTSPEGTHFSLDIAKAYPDSAGVQSWKRRLNLGKQSEMLTLTESWTVQAGGNKLQWHFITPCRVDRGKKDRLHLVSAKGTALELQYASNLLEVTIEEIPMTDTSDEPLRKYWPDGLRRIVFTANKAVATGEAVFHFK